MIIDGIARLIGDGTTTDLQFSESAGGNVFVEALPNDPVRVVAVYAGAGEEADSALPYDAPGVRIIVRSDRDARWGLATWAAIYSRLHGLRNVTLPDGTYLVYCLSEQSGPAHLQPDDHGRVLFSMNLRTETKNPTNERPE